MLAKSDVARIFDTVLSIPGMNDSVKLSITIARRNVLLLSKIVERTLHGGDDKSVSILEALSKEALDEFATLMAELLEKAGLTELNEKLKSF